MSDDDVRRRLAQWSRARGPIERERLQRLRSMTEDEAREAAEQLLGLIDEVPRKEGTSGLIIQQRLFRHVGR